MDAIDVKKMEDDFMGEDDDDVESMPMDAVGQEVDISKDGGVKKKILVVGDGWEQPQKGDKVRVHYVGTLEDGTKFDSSVDRDEPFEFKLGAGQVIKGWDVGVATMKKGEKALLTLRSDYGYGDKGSPPKIAPGATLLFEVELLSWVSINDLSPEKDGSILKSILKEADIGVWDRPHENDIVTIQYSATVEGSEEPFVADAEAEFEVSKGHFCPAMEIVVKDMKLGEKVKAKVGPKYAFGDAGREGVPPGSTVELTIELKHVKVVKFVDPNKVGTVVKTILTEGKNWQTPNDGASVTVSWTATLEDGTEFDKVENAELTIEDEQFPCEGLELAVSTMKAGEVADVVIKDPELGFGKAGLPDKVPGNAIVTYHVQLEKFTGGPNVWEMNTTEKIALAEKRKLQGNKAFKEGKYERAQRMYRKAEDTLSLDSKDLQESERVKLKEIHVSCSLNQAATAIKLHDYRAAITAATKALEKTPGNVKALFRRCQAYTETGDFVEAEADIKSALLMEPANVDLLAAKRKLKQRMRVQNQQDAKLFGAMFKSVGKIYSDMPAPKPIEEIGMGTGADEGNPTVPEVDMATDGADPEPLPVREAPIDSAEASPIAV